MTVNIRTNEFGDVVVVTRDKYGNGNKYKFHKLFDEEDAVAPKPSEKVTHTVREELEDAGYTVYGEDDVNYCIYDGFYIKTSRVYRSEPPAVLKTTWHRPDLLDGIFVEAIEAHGVETYAFKNTDDGLMYVGGDTSRPHREKDISEVPNEIVERLEDEGFEFRRDG
ncbi:hypothetical protein [Halosimplex halobium]|uniref:hypothetical protein n=1 Tax=Halosimplex halobium TaxID=3396618 RepID=UPI003F574910